MGCNWLPGDHGQGRTLIVPSTAACFVPLPQHSTVQYSTALYSNLFLCRPQVALDGHCRCRETVTLVSSLCCHASRAVVSATISNTRLLFSYSPSQCNVAAEEALHWVARQSKVNRRQWSFRAQCLAAEAQFDANSFFSRLAFCDTVTGRQRPAWSRSWDADYCVAGVMWCVKLGHWGKM